MTPFATLSAIQDGILDGFFGESFTVTATGVNPSDPDARRARGASATFTGIWNDDGGNFHARNAEGHRDSATRRLGANRLSIDFEVASVPFIVGQGFVVTRLADASRYMVEDITADDVGRAVLSLSAATKPRT